MVSSIPGTTTIKFCRSWPPLLAASFSAANVAAAAAAAATAVPPFIEGGGPPRDCFGADFDIDCDDGPLEERDEKLPEGGELGMGMLPAEGVRVTVVRPGPFGKLLTISRKGLQ